MPLLKVNGCPLPSAHLLHPQHLSQPLLTSPQPHPPAETAQPPSLPSQAFQRSSPFRTSPALCLPEVFSNWAFSSFRGSSAQGLFHLLRCLTKCFRFSELTEVQVPVLHTLFCAPLQEPAQGQAQAGGGSALTDWQPGQWASERLCGEKAGVQARTPGLDLQLYPPKRCGSGQVTSVNIHFIYKTGLLTLAFPS